MSETQKFARKGKSKDESYQDSSLPAGRKRFPRSAPTVRNLFFLKQARTQSNWKCNWLKQNSYRIVELAWRGPGS